MALSAKDVLADVKNEFKARKFAAGLCIAMIDLFVKLRVPSLKAKTFQAVLAKYPRQEHLASGQKANTLVLQIKKGELVSLRPFYNNVEKVIRADNKRFGYPSCAPHATQAWSGYDYWLQALSTFDEVTLLKLREDVLQFVLKELPSHEFDPASVRAEPPLLAAVLQSFELTSQKDEPTGAAYQGVVFGFMRADNPHLQIEISKVRTGSKRLQRVGDVDGWDGGRLAVTAEVKQFAIREKDVDDLKAFANEASRRGAIGAVVALGFDDGVREVLEAEGVHPLDRDDLLRIVALWDTAKQRIAVSSMLYYFEHVEKNSSLVKRLKAFIEHIEAKP